MACDWTGACRAMPICHYCGACGQHCECADSEAKAMAGRMVKIDAIRRAYKDEVRYQQNLVFRYRKRWQRLRREFDELRGKMDVAINVTDPDPDRPKLMPYQYRQKGES